jgi:hypothetical protein
LPAAHEPARQIRDAIETGNQDTALSNRTMVLASESILDLSPHLGGQKHHAGIRSQPSCAIHLAQRSPITPRLGFGDDDRNVGFVHGLEPRLPLHDRGLRLGGLSLFCGSRLRGV